MEKEPSEKYALKKSTRLMLDDLIPKYIIEDLVKWGAINKNQSATILKEVDNDCRIKRLLAFIRNGGPEAFNLFEKSLRKDDGFLWIADSLIKNQNAYKSYKEKQNLMMSSGGVPQRPSHLYRRKKAVKDVQRQITWMFQHPKGSELSKWVVTWGIGGGGKSVLIASALRNPVLLNDLGIKHIFYVWVGKDVEDDNLLGKIHTICEKMDSSFVGHNPLSVEMASSRLRTIFAKEEYQDTLLVLDDVWEKSVVSHFDFGGRVLLTTRDRSIMDDASGEKQFVDISQHVIDKKESRNFFATLLEVDVGEVPESEATEIWDCVNGHTMSLVTICSSMRSQKNIGVTERLQRSLRKLRTNRQNAVSESLRMSFDSLNPEEQERYTDLAIFPRAVGISSDTLCRLWEMELYDVDELMNKLYDKCLVGMVTNGGAFIHYLIHDLYFKFLRDERGDTFPERHRRMIERYLNSSNGRFDCLPEDDAYILVYLGHHLSKAMMYDEMPDVFLNLKVLLNKLKVVGPSDVLGDFNRYKKHITKDGLYHKKFEDFLNFVRQNFDKLSMASIDKVQVALSQPNESEVYIQAEVIAKEERKKLYIVWNNGHNVETSSIINTKHHQGSALCAIFSSDSRFVISAGMDKTVRIWVCESGREVIRLVGHKAQVNHVCSHFDKNAKKEVILSCSDDLTVIVWHILLPIDLQGKLAIITDSFLVFANHSSTVKCCSLNKSGLLAASIDATGILKVWRTGNGNEMLSWPGCGQGSNNDCSCDYSHVSNKIACVAVDSLQLWDTMKKLPDWELERRRMSFTSCHFSPDGATILATLGTSVIVYSTKEGLELFKLDEPDGQILVDCASSQDGSLVAASTQRSSVVVWSRESKQVVAYHLGHKGKYVNSVAFEPLKESKDFEGYKLVSSDDKGGVIIWRGASEEKSVIQLLRQVFSVQFDNQGIPCIAAASFYNKIQVLDDMGNIISAQNGSSIASSKITCCALSSGRDKVLYGTSNGALMLFDVQNAIATSVQMPPNATKGAITHCAFDSKGNVIISTNERGQIFISIAHKQPRGHNNRITDLKLFGNDSLLVTSSLDHTLKVWKVFDGSLQYDCIGHTGSVLCCDVREKDNLIVSGSEDKIVIVWDADDGVKLMQLESHMSYVRCCKFSTCEDYLVASGDDAGVVKLWQFDADQIAEAKRRAGKGKRGSNYFIHDTPVTLRAASNGSWVHDLAISPDGSQLVTCTETIKWWSLTDLVYDDGHSNGVHDEDFDLNANFRLDFQSNGQGDMISTDVVDSNVNSNIPQLKGEGEMPFDEIDSNSMLNAPSADQVFFVKGSDVKRIFCSADFSSFVTIDDTGVMYHLSKLKLS